MFPLVGSIKIDGVAIGDDLRLAYFILLNAAVIGASAFAVRRWTRDPVQRAIDVMLLWYLLQYVAVCLPGALHCLSTATMSAAALLLAAGLVAFARRSPDLNCLPRQAFSPSPGTPGEGRGRGSIQNSPPPEYPETKPARWERYVYLMAGLVVTAYLLVIIHMTEIISIIDSDAVTYHVPAAVQWIQTKRLGLFATWFFNPANTFSPLAGSAFIAWGLAPMHGDVLARFVEMPAIVLMFLAVLQLARALGANAIAAALLGVAVACSRLATSEIESARDDMFLVAFALIGVAACGRPLRDRFGPWRLGIALGLMLATKYTAVISLPLWLLMPDVVKRGNRWRTWGLAVACAVVIAGPWYLRNLVLTGNPIYPLEVRLFGHVILPGLFEVLRSERLRSWFGVSKVFQDSYHGLPTPLLVCFVIGWLCGVGSAVKRWREPLVRACVLGPLACIAIFLLRSPYGEVRFIYPAILVMFACVGLIPAREPWQRYAQIALAAVIAAAAVYTGYKVKDELFEALETTAIVVVLIGAVLLLYALLNYKVRIVGAVVGVLLLAGMIYVYWNPYVHQCEAAVPDFYNRYPELEGGWRFVRDNLSADAKIAYTQTFLIYPLYDAHLERRLTYVPPRPDVTDVLHLPHFPAPTSGEPINKIFAQLLDERADRATWLSRLRQSGAQFLFVYHAEGVPNEERWAKGLGFEELFSDRGTAVFRVSAGAW